MSSIVTVVFDQHREYELLAHADRFDREAAARWLDEQWQALECEPTHPMGKVLLLDKILGVALYAGEKHFAQADAWARDYADVVATLLALPAVRVDLAERKVG